MKHNFDEVVKRYNTYCTQWDYIEDRFGKKDILPFSISDTDFKVPKEIHQQLQSVIDHQIYGYSRWNHDDFKGAITKYFRKRLFCEIENDWVLYSPSVLYSISVLFRLLSKSGDKIFTFTPMYDSFYNVIQKNDRQLITSTLVQKESNYQIDFEDVEEKIKDVQVLLLCSPHNPTGKVFTKDELEQLTGLCKKYNVIIISDEIHMDVVMPGNVHTSIIAYQSLYSQIYVVSSGSKTFNFPALIGSYAIIPDQNVYRSFIHQTKERDFVNSASILGVHATITGYQECNYYTDELIQYIYQNFQYVEQFIKENMKDIKFTIPQATYLAWIDCRDVPYTSKQIQKVLINIGGIGIMPGEMYGGEKFLRLNCGCPKAKLEEGMKRFKQAMDALYG